MTKRLFPALMVLALAASAVSQTPTPAPPAAQAQPAAQQAPTPPAKGDPLLEPPPLPQSTVTLIGGTVDKIDRVRNRLTVRVFGGGKMRMFFDDRTHIYRNGVETTMMGIKKDERVYVDTQLDGTRVFARNIRVQAEAGPADARGQLLMHDRETGKIIVRDELSSRPVAFKLGDTTKVLRGDKTLTLADIREGSLVDVTFTPETARNGNAQQIRIIAMPGDNFTFEGNVTHVDVRNSLFAMRNKTDGKNYEIYFDSSAEGADQLAVGTGVNVSALFDGHRYTARQMNVLQAEATPPAEPDEN